MDALGYSSWVLTALLIVPLLGMIAVFAAGERHSRTIALGFALLEMLISIPLWWAFNPASGDMQFAASARGRDLTAEQILTL